MIINIETYNILRLHMKNKIDEEIKNIMATVFKINTREITNESNPSSIDKWDSLKHIDLIIALEEEFEIKLDEDEIASMVSFSIICATIRAHLD